MPRFDERYAAVWERFTRLDRTVDSLAHDFSRFRRWLMLPQITFIIPITEPAVLDQLIAWQAHFRPWMAYDPLEAGQLHLTLHTVGRLRRGIGLFWPHTWRRSSVEKLATRMRPVFESTEAFEIRIGPLNAFPNALVAEIHDPHHCLRLLRTRLLRALPLSARPLSPWPYVPHVTLGYWGQQTARPLIEALTPYRSVDPVVFRVSTVKFTLYFREVGRLSPQLLNRAHEEIIADYALTP